MKKLLALAALVTLTACGNNDVSFDTLETARKQSKENAEFNAKAWRAQTPTYAQLSLISRGDSTQTPACPQPHRQPPGAVPRDVAQRWTPGASIGATLSLRLQSKGTNRPA